MRFDTNKHWIPYWVHFISGLPPVDRCIYKTAALCTDEKLQFYGSVKTLKQLTAYSAREVEYCLGRLETAGWLKRVGGGREEGRSVKYSIQCGWAYEVGPNPYKLAIPSDKFLYPIHPESPQFTGNSIKKSSAPRAEGSAPRAEGSALGSDNNELKGKELENKLFNVPQEPIENRHHEVGEEV